MGSIGFGITDAFMWHTAKVNQLRDVHIKSVVMSDALRQLQNTYITKIPWAS